MISDDERREVVKRLRNGGVARDPEEAYTLLLWCVGIRPQLPATSTYEDAMVRLADLIDRPTCRIGYVPGSADRSCSACGVTFSTGTYQGGDHEEYEFMFCPNCGAMVTEVECCDVPEL